ncbi:hypothetical protein sos41_30920 [Alphaproteobacteria bacterium SO-S41]|nr:hypothetical protein sos41_30920 [Alphaproteobacteria bacterium SO-S41]
MPVEAWRRHRLDGFLGTVTPAIALRLAKAVETDRLLGGALPHDEIMGALRPRLRDAQNRLSRVASPRRLVCAAFEDVLFDGVRRRKQRGRIARSSIAPVWSWLEATLPKDVLELLDVIRDKLLTSGAEFADTEVAAFQRAAAAALLKEIPTGEPADPRIAGGAKLLGGIDIATDAYDMARMLEIGTDLLRLQREFPKPMHTLSESDISLTRAVWENVVAEHPDSASYVVFLMLGRLEKPWEIMRLAGALSRKTDDIVVSRTDAGFVGDLLLSDLEDCVAILRPMRADAVEPLTVQLQVETFAHLSTGIVREIGIKRDGLWGKRLMAARGAISDEMERLLGRARKDIIATLPMVRKGGFGLRATGRAPDFTRRVDPAKAARAIELASIIAGVRPHAMAGAFAGMLAEIEEPVTEHLRHFTTEMIEQIQGIAAEQRPQVELHVSHAVDLTRLLLGAEEGDLIRRRAAAATAAADEESATLVA